MDARTSPGVSRLLAQVFPHDDGCRDADVQTLYLAELGDGEGPDSGTGRDLRADAKFLVPKDEGAAFGEGRFGKGNPLDRIQRKQGVAALGQLRVTGCKAVMKAGRYPFERPHGRRRIEKIDADQMNFTGTQRFGTAKYFRNVVAGF